MGSIKETIALKAMTEGVIEFDKAQKDLVRCMACIFEFNQIVLTKDDIRIVSIEKKEGKSKLGDKYDEDEKYGVHVCYENEDGEKYERLGAFKTKEIARLFSQSCTHIGNEIDKYNYSQKLL